MSRGTSDTIVDALLASSQEELASSGLFSAKEGRELAASLERLVTIARRERRRVCIYFRCSNYTSTGRPEVSAELNSRNWAASRGATLSSAIDTICEGVDADYEQGRFDASAIVEMLRTIKQPRWILIQIVADFALPVGSRPFKITSDCHFDGGPVPRRRSSATDRDAMLALTRVLRKTEAL